MTPATSITQADLFKTIDRSLTTAIKQADADQAFQICTDLWTIQDLAGLALARVLWTIHQHWTDFGIEDNFLDNAALRLGKHRHTIERYVRVHEMITNSVPEDVVDNLEDRNIRDLFPIANAVAQGYEIESETWDKIASAVDGQQIAKIIREDVKNVAPKSGSITLWMDRDGTLWAFCNDERFFVGSLEINTDDETVQKAINRIVSNTGITKQ